MSAAAAAADAAQPLDGIVPYINRNSPQLRGRNLAKNPIQGLWEAAAKIALRGELLLTAAVDKQRYAPYVMAALAGLSVGAVSWRSLGCHSYAASGLLNVEGSHVHGYCLSPALVLLHYAPGVALLRAHIGHSPTCGTCILPALMGCLDGHCSM